MRTVDISKCHSADVFYMSSERTGKRTPYCTYCQEKCEAEEVCEYCRGTGKETFDEDDGEGHITKGTGTRRCRHLED